MGRAPGAQHRRGGQSTIPINGLDYFFMTKGCIKKMSQLGHEFPETEEGDAAMNLAHECAELAICFIVKCSKSKTVMVYVVPCEGLGEDDYVLNTLVKDMA